jgi:hypothetical protein
VGFVGSRINDIVRLPIDMSCLSSNLVKRIAAKVKIEELDNLKDRKDKLTSKLYMKKLEIQFENE